MLALERPPKSLLRDLSQVCFVLWACCGCVQRAPGNTNDPHRAPACPLRPIFQRGKCIRANLHPLEGHHRAHTQFHHPRIGITSPHLRCDSLTCHGRTHSRTLALERHETSLQRHSCAISSEFVSCCGLDVGVYSE